MFLFLLTAVTNVQEDKLNRDVLDNCLMNIAKGKTDAFEELYKRTSTSVYAYALSILKNTFDAQDVMHDSYVKIYYNANNYHSFGKPMAWIFTIVKNEALKKIEANSKIVEINEDVCFKAEKNFEEVESDIILDNCFKILTDEEREIIIMHAVAGFKHREIAQQMQLPISTILSKYNRAIKKLKQECERQMNTQ